MELHEHEEKSQHRYEKMMHAIHETKKESDMSNAPMIFEGGGMGGGVGAAMGGGLGAGLLGGILGGALLGGNGGLFGRNGNGVVAGDGLVTSSQLTAALAGVQDTQMNTAVLQELGAIKGMIPAAEGQVQLALAGVQNALGNQINTNLVSNTQGFANVNQNIAGATANVIAVGEQIKDSINLTSAATQLAIANSVAQGLQNTNVIMTTVRDDGDKTRALLVAQNEATLRDANTALQIRLAETQAESRARGTEVNVTQTVNQNQAQLQAQQQQQQQLLLLSNLAHVVGNLQNAVATNSNLIVGNTGAVATGTQTANPVNVRA